MNRHNLMKRIRPFRTALLTATLFVAIVSSFDQSFAGQFRVDGAGGFSCRIFTKRTGTPRQIEAIQWAIGYLSGRITADPGAWHRDFHGADGVAQALSAYCLSRPSASIVEAADWFFEPAHN